MLCLMTTLAEPPSPRNAPIGLAPGTTSLKSVLRIFFSARGTNPWVVLTCLIVASLCEGFGVATLVPLLGAATGSNNQSFVSESVRGVLHSLGPRFVAGHADHRPRRGHCCSSSVISLFVMRKVGYANAEVANLMRVRLIKQMLGARWSYLLEHPTGRIANAFSGEVSPLAAGLPAGGAVRRRGGRDRRDAGAGARSFPGSWPWRRSRSGSPPVAPCTFWSAAPSRRGGRRPS